MRRLALLLGLLALLAFPAPVAASVTQYASGSCTFHWHAHGDTVPFVCLTESSALGGDKLILTGSSDIPDLRFVSHAPTGYCSPKVFDIDDTWNDCITGVWAKLGTNDSLCLYDDNQYNENHYRVSMPSTPSGNVWTVFDSELGANDKTSSVMLQQSGASCGEGGV